MNSCYKVAVQLSGRLIGNIWELFVMSQWYVLSIIVTKTALWNYYGDILGSFSSSDWVLLVTIDE